MIFDDTKWIFDDFWISLNMLELQGAKWLPAGYSSCWRVHACAIVPVLTSHLKPAAAHCMWLRPIVSSCNVMTCNVL